MTAADVGSRPRTIPRAPVKVINRGIADCILDRQTVTPVTEQVAGIVSGISAIGKACDALRTAGWRASIAGNRITINDEVAAQLIGAGAAGGADAIWVIRAIAGKPPVWVVGGERQP